MVLSIKVDISRLQKLEPWAQQLKPNVQKLLQKAFTDALVVVKSNERYRTGNMRTKTTVQSTGTGSKIIAAAPYSGYQNFGTKYMKGTHFMEAGVNSITKSLTSGLPQTIAIK